MTTLPFSVVDVFTTTPYLGNPLAVIDNTSGVLSKEQMRLIARQFNLSETTFFTKPNNSNADFKLQSFLPNGREVFGIGHNILGVWWYIAQAGRLNFCDPIEQYGNGKEVYAFNHEIGDDISEVKVIRYRATGSDTFSVSLRQAPPKPHDYHPDVATLARSIGVPTGGIGLPGSTQVRPQVMSTSTTKHLLVPIMSTDVLDKATIQYDKLSEQLAVVDRDAYGIYLFAVEGGNKYQARFFSPGMAGEDPATGSAAGPLARYLYDHGLLEMKDDQGKIEVTQGLQVGRRCRIHVVLDAQERQTPQTYISGGGGQVMTGTIVVPEEVAGD